MTATAYHTTTEFTRLESAGIQHKAAEIEAQSKEFKFIYREDN